MHHRLELCKLDPAILKNVQDDDSYQLNLKDLYELEKIEDPKKRNEVLKEYSGRTLKWRVQNALRDIEKEKAIAKISALMEDYGVENYKTKSNYFSPEYDPGFKTLEKIEYDNVPEKLIFKKPKDKCYWYPGYKIYVFIKVKPSKAESERKKEAHLFRANKNKLEERIKQMNARRREFIRTFITTGPKVLRPEEFIKQCMVIAFENSPYGIRLLDMSDVYLQIPYPNEEQKWQILNLRAEYIALLIAEAGISNSMLTDSYGCYSNNAGKSYSELVKLLNKYGYNLTQEEQEIIDGTHELYKKA